MQLVMGTEREVIRNNKNPWKCCWMRKWWSYSGESDKIALYAILWNSEWERRDSSRAEYKSLNAEGTRDLFELSSFQVAACCIFINPFLPLFSSYLTEMLPSKVDILSIGPCITNFIYYHESGMILQSTVILGSSASAHESLRKESKICRPGTKFYSYSTCNNKSWKQIAQSGLWTMVLLILKTSNYISLYLLSCWCLLGAVVSWVMKSHGGWTIKDIKEALVLIIAPLLMTSNLNFSCQQFLCCGVLIECFLQECDHRIIQN